MSRNDEVLRLRILLGFLSGGTEGTVSGLARTLGEEKYTVSRGLAALERAGLVERSDPRRPRLTGPGEERARQYARRLEEVSGCLLQGGVGLAAAREDALRIVLSCSEMTLEALARAERLFRLREELGELRRFDGGRLCARMEDGEYTLPFVLYRTRLDRPEPNLSRANWGFAPGCRLTVRAGRGTVGLRVVEVEAPLEGTPRRARVRGLMYFDRGEYVRAEDSGGIISFPAEALGFVALGDRACRVLHGSVWLRMDRGIRGVESDPVSAIFTLLL